ncbi:MAG: hypothetical protein WC423_22290 [Vulcanimicrobiota bacterium]
MGLKAKDKVRFEIDGEVVRLRPVPRADFRKGYGAVSPREAPEDFAGVREQLTNGKDPPVDFPSSHPCHSRRRVVNVDKFSGTNLTGSHPGKFGIYPSEVGGPLSMISFPLRYLPFHLTAVSTLPGGFSSSQCLTVKI